MVKKKKARLEFEESLAIPQENFKRSFDFVDEKLSESNCDDSLKFIKKFLIENNVEEHFEDNIIL